MCDQDKNRRPDSSFGKPQNQPHQPELRKRMHEARCNRAEAPRHKQNRNRSLGAPVLRQVRCRHLQEQVSPEEQSHSIARLPRVHVEFGAHRRQRHGNVRAIDVRDGVHHE